MAITSSPNKKQLLVMKTKAMRSGAWFRVLKRIDRALLDLTIKVIDNVRSAKLAKSVTEILGKLENAIKDPSSRFYEVGMPLAQKISIMCQKLGNLSASGWAYDSSFIKFLGVLQVNADKTFTL
ncbi:MAG: hypothetical protein LBH74_08635 [Nitrososphaerota archaeon]|uniref:hypothetical protein n=1 Tax=Candidatus Bathycorpusculum sp. TaxID=2994959 RepID=UPI00281EED2A|nr:hypothetical protein [Candidatus Termitimicrobium sp.]MCL2430975.1 hypothetical protein [Candidatus Termitimicrobium sp.]MDR0493684.1 hypothetical protein [Nitrososphaerota archaeon]